MKILYYNKNAEKQFNPNFRNHWKYPLKVKERLLKLHLFLESATSLKDVVDMRIFHFHPLIGDRKGEWSIYVGNTGYRVTLIPCDDDENEILEGDIIAQCKSVKIVMIKEVSNHYE